MVRFIKKLLRRTEKPSPVKKAAPQKAVEKAEAPPPPVVEKSPVQTKILTAEGFKRRTVGK
jgi:hypothetical protein